MTVSADDAFRRGVAALQTGQLGVAEPLFKTVLREEPKHIAALNLLGIVLTQRSSYAEAEKYLRLALQQNANSEATLYNYGVVLKALHRPDEALERFSQALAINPAVAETWNNRGAVLNDLKRYREAVADFDRAIEANAHYADAFFNKGNALAELKLHEQSLAAYDRALALKPDLADAWLGRGNISAEMRRYDDALAAYERALVLAPGLAKAWLGRGNVFYELKRYEEAIAAHDRALTLDPDLPEAWLGLGNLYIVQSRHDEALTAYDKAIARKPDLARAWLGRGYAFMTTNRQSDALATIDRALTLEPELAEAWHCRGYVLSVMNRTMEAFAAFDKALSIKPDYADAISDRIFVLDFSDAGFEKQQAARKHWWQQVGSVIAERSQIRHLNNRDPNRRIKLGYVSGDFRRHSAARCFRPMLSHHDKNQFEVTCYSTSPREDDVTNEFQRAADRWRNVTRLTEDELSERIQADQIDILVELSGHTAGHRLGVFARKPAPVQVSAGATGTGLPTIDYLFSDPVTCPAEVRPLFAEKVFDLPCIMTIEALADHLRPSDPPVLSKGYVTFGAFNRISKISDDAVSLWARILHAVPRSRLLIKHFALDEAAMRGLMLERFSVHGVAPERLTLLGSTSHDDHLAAFKGIDISLDPFPQNGGISTLESLQMGVPVVAILGNSISSRAAGSILYSIGMDDWVSENVDDYLAIAVKFAAMPDHLKKLRYDLPGRVVNSPVGNPAMYTKAVEKAYRKMWADYCASHVEQFAPA